ncbi:hypothetical protein Slin14017_G019000 [Septoria linicola]|nr:hypothetical protein Slin14017_G019000 [Septoria linicola]
MEGAVKEAFGTNIWGPGVAKFGLHAGYSQSSVKLMTWTANLKYVIEKWVAACHEETVYDKALDRFVDALKYDPKDFSSSNGRRLGTHGCYIPQQTTSRPK